MEQAEASHHPVINDCDITTGQKTDAAVTSLDNQKSEEPVFLNENGHAHFSDDERVDQGPTPPDTVEHQAEDQPASPKDGNSGFASAEDTNVKAAAKANNAPVYSNGFDAVRPDLPKDEDSGVASAEESNVQIPRKEADDEAIDSNDGGAFQPKPPKDEDSGIANAEESNAQAATEEADGAVVESNNVDTVQPDALELYNDYYRAATEEERATWKGFIELDSESTTWNQMIKKLGINDIELIDVETLPDYPVLNGKFKPPVLGIVFCHDVDEEYDINREPCPDHVWFCNQLNSNSCGTMALLNIINNVPSIDLGPELAALKERTRYMTPTDRGYEVAACDFVRAAHNFCATKIEMLEADLALQHTYEESLKNKRKRRRAINIGKATKRRRGGKNGKMDLANKTYHFIAYVPVDGEIWRLDGLDPEPSRAGTFADGEDWVQVLKPVLLGIMMNSPFAGFNIMALVPGANEWADIAAADRSTDYGPIIHTWLSMLAHNETLRDIAEATKMGK